MNATEKRHDDIVIERRFAEHAQTHTARQVYAVTYPNHTDRGTERTSYDETEHVALELAEAKGLSVWYEETPQSGKRTLIKSFRPPEGDVEPSTPPPDVPSRERP